MAFAMIHCTEKITDSYFCTGIFFCLCSENNLHQSRHDALSRPFLDGSIDTITVYYSHKNSYFGNTFLK